MDIYDMSCQDVTRHPKYRMKPLQSLFSLIFARSKLARLCCSNTLAYRFSSKRETARSLDHHSYRCKKFRLVQDSNPWPLWYRCSTLSIELTSQLGEGRSGQGFESRTSLNFFQAFFLQLQSCIYNCDDLLSYN